MNLELNNFYNMDCMKGIKEIPNKYFELAIVDTPYGIGESGKNNKTRSKIAKAKDYKPFYGNDTEPMDKEYFKELFRVSKNQIIWGANHFISLIPYNSPCWIVWDKVNGNSDFADCELAWTSFKRATRIIRYMWHGMNQGKSITEGHIMQGDKRKNEVRIHPTQKPVNLYKWILMNYAKQGDKILDTHVGSASSLIACYQMGFDYMGFEKDKMYYDKANKRLEDIKAQINFFDVI